MEAEESGVGVRHVTMGGERVMTRGGGERGTASVGDEE